VLIWGRDSQNWTQVNCPYVSHLRWAEPESSPENEFSFLKHLRETNNYLIIHAFHQYCWVTYFLSFIHFIFHLLQSPIAIFPSFSHLHRTIFLDITLLTYHVNINSCQISGCVQVFFGPAILIVGQAGIIALQVELNGQVPVRVVGEELLTFIHCRKRGRTSSWDTIYIYLYTFFYIYIYIYIFSIYYIAIYLQQTMLNCCIMHCTFIDVKSLWLS